MQKNEALLAAVDAVREKLDGQRPYTPEQEERTRRWFLPRFIYCSSALGRQDPVTGRETVLFLESQVVSGGHHIDEFLGIERHQRALEVCEVRAREGGALDVDFVQLLHRKLTEGSRLLGDERPGRWKKDPSPPVRRRGHEVSYAPPERVGELMERLLEELARRRTSEHPLQAIAYFYFQFYLIQPFATHNGEVARLLTTTALWNHGYPGLIVAPDGVGDLLDALVAVHRTVPAVDRELLSPRFDLGFLLEFFCGCLTRTGERIFDLAAGKRLNTMTFSRKVVAEQQEQLTQFLNTRNLSWRARATGEVRAVYQRVDELVQPLALEGPLYDLQILRSELISSHAASPALRAVLPEGEAGVVGELQLSITPSPTMKGLTFPDPEQLLIGVASTQYGIHLVFVVASDPSQRPMVHTGPMRNAEWPKSTLEAAVVKGINKRRMAFEYELNLLNASRSQRFKLKRMREGLEEEAEAAVDTGDEPDVAKPREKRLDGLSPSEPPLSF
ncbi:MAG: Fic family protein [Planctomycetota bacterium]